MKVTTSKALNNWYGVYAAAGGEFYVPEGLEDKAKAMDFLKPVRAKKVKADVEDVE